MDPLRFDQLSRFFADRRRSRRQAVRDLAAGGLAAGLLGAAGLDAAAQGTPPAGTPPAVATPSAAAIETSKSTTFLFVQSFTAGSLVPQSGKAGMYTLTLRRGIDQTVYFSDRPDRIFGLVETGQFLKGLGFQPANPPNAALVAHQGPGRSELIVLELFNPQYDASTETLTYDVKILQDTRHTPLHFNETPVTQLGSGRTYGASALFIDDCANGQVCCKNSANASFIFPTTIGCCWSWSSFACTPCGGNYDAFCNSHYGSYCNGSCYATFDPSRCNGYQLGC